MLTTKIGKSIPSTVRPVQLIVQAKVYAADLNDWVNNSPGRGPVAPAEGQEQKQDCKQCSKLYSYVIHWGNGEIQILDSWQQSELINVPGPLANEKIKKKTRIMLMYGIQDTRVWGKRSLWEIISHHCHYLSCLKIQNLQKYAIF